MDGVTMPEPLEIDWPELHSQALGCGVEDRNIHDRYEAAEYGWQDAVDKCAERVPDEIFDREQMEAYAAARVREALEDAAQTCEARIGTGDPGIDTSDCDAEATECAAAIRTLIP